MSSQPNRFSQSAIPHSAGVGLKPQHYREILNLQPDIGFFEVHAENYMGAGGPPHRYLTAIRERYPLSLHGVGLSIGSSLNGLGNKEFAITVLGSADVQHVEDEYINKRLTIHGSFAHIFGGF